MWCPDLHYATASFSLVSEVLLWRRGSSLIAKQVTGNVVQTWGLSPRAGVILEEILLSWLPCTMRCLSTFVSIASAFWIGQDREESPEDLERGNKKPCGEHSDVDIPVWSRGFRRVTGCCGVVKRRYRCPLCSVRLCQWHCYSGRSI